jgi:hypothetical protein
VGELVLVADVADDQLVKAAALAAGDAAFVQDCGDLPVGVVVEELVDQGDGVGVGLPGLAARERPGQLEGVALATG